MRKRLQALRDFLQQQNLAGLLVPRTDEFLNEFIPAYAQRLAWLTGFTGSAGLALVTPLKAILFVDGRYTLQAAQEVDLDVIDIKPWTQPFVEEAFQDIFQPQDHLAYDPWLHSIFEIERYERITQKNGFFLKPLPKNPLDALWENQPSRPKEPLTAHPLAFSGSPSIEKRAAVLAASTEADCWILAASDSLAWLLNIRGNDIPYTPVPQAYGVLHREGRVDFFCDPQKISSETRSFLGEDVHCFPLADFGDYLQQNSPGKRVSVDPATTPAAVSSFLTQACVIFEPDPCVLPKALKNKTELTAMKKAHVRDGVALVRFLHWLHSIPLDGSESELSAAEKLNSFRQEQEGYRGPSFETIAGHGPNGAIVHYRATPQSNRPLTAGALFLVDSGGQYIFGGTTDVTRTIALGPPTPLQKEHYTRVLKGHIALAQALFPPGTRGSQLDVLARLPLWEKGLDFDHGTGHGVGSYLAVHEGPQRISRAGGDTALQPGMVVSNEPGYYQTGDYGIRLESLVVVVEKKISSVFGFETLTLAPFDPLLIDVDLLAELEKAWIHAYHLQVYTTLSPYLDAATQHWLKEIVQFI